jgi:ribonuclease P protein component
MPERLRKRQDFLALRKAKRISGPAFALVAGKRLQAEAGEAARFGITVTRQTGNAVQRNRIRRRLRQAILAAGDLALAQFDYVLIARPAALTLPFADLVAQLRSGLDRAAGSGANPPPRRTLPAN